MPAHTINQDQEKGPVRWLALSLNALASVTLLALMLVTCVDVVGRYVFNSPLTGSTELTEMAVAIVVLSVLPVISWRGEHVVVDILDRFVPPGRALVRDLLFNLLAAVALGFVGQRIIVLGNRSLSYGEVSEYLSIPTGWIINFIGVMFFMTAVLLVTVGFYRSVAAYRLRRDAAVGGDSA